MPSNKITQKEAIALIKSGNFTIAYHDEGMPCLYEGKHEIDDLTEDGELYEFEQNFDGYIPEVVYCLTIALNGAIETI